MAIPYVIGLDLGQAADPTGLAIIEWIPTAVGQEYAVRHLVRFPPGTSFATIATTLRHHHEHIPRQTVPRLGRWSATDLVLSSLAW